MTEENKTYIICDDFEGKIWFPVAGIRWYKTKTKKVLQQLWKNEYGIYEWKDVPIVEEEQK